MKRQNTCDEALSGDREGVLRGRLSKTKVVWKVLMEIHYFVSLLKISKEKFEYRYCLGEQCFPPKDRNY